MASRFIVTGVQLGMLKGLAEAEASGELSKEIIEVINSILKSQYVGSSLNSIEDDVSMVIAYSDFEV